MTETKEYIVVGGPMHGEKVIVRNEADGIVRDGYKYKKSCIYYEGDRIDMLIPDCLEELNKLI